MMTMTNMLIGAAAGAAATLPMTVVMETLHERLPGEPAQPLPPREITEGVAAKAGVQNELGEREKEALRLPATSVRRRLRRLFGMVAPRDRQPTYRQGGFVSLCGRELPRLAAAAASTHARTIAARTGPDIAAHVVYGAARCVLLQRGRYVDSDDSQDFACRRDTKTRRPEACPLTGGPRSGPPPRRSRPT